MRCFPAEHWAPSGSLSLCGAAAAFRLVIDPATSMWFLLCDSTTMIFSHVVVSLMCIIAGHLLCHRSLLTLASRNSCRIQQEEYGIFFKTQPRICVKMPRWLPLIRIATSSTQRADWTNNQYNFIEHDYHKDVVHVIGFTNVSWRTRSLSQIRYKYIRETVQVPARA